MKVKETFINETKGYQYGDSGWYEPHTEHIGRLFRSLQREYGRCTGKVHIDTQSGTKPVGWVFEKRMQYEDARSNRPQDYYIRQVWVQVAEDGATSDEPVYQSEL